jgi:5'-nucleotidase
MNILLTNDDGIQADGINMLFEALSPYYQVYMIAPDKERSACSNAITVRRKLKLTKLDSRRYTADGFPADCVNIAMHSGKIPVPDLVISGINHGPNMGDDVFFSGTAAGARTAFIFGRGGIAVSIDHWGEASPHMKDAAGFVLDFVKEKENVLFHQPMFFNINYPDLPRAEIKGVKYTSQGRRIYFDKFITEEISENESLLALDGIIESVDREGTDVTELKRGYITVTPLMLDCTDYDYLTAVTG